MNVLNIGEYTPGGQLVQKFKIDPMEIGKQSLLLIRRGPYNRKWNGLSAEANTIKQENLRAVANKKLENFQVSQENLNKLAQTKINERKKKSRSLRNIYLQQLIINNKQEFTQQELSELLNQNRNVLKNAIEIRGLLNDPNKTKEDILSFLKNNQYSTLEWTTKIWAKFFNRFSSKTGGVNEQQILDGIPGGGSKHEAYEGFKLFKNNLAQPTVAKAQTDAVVTNIVAVNPAPSVVTNQQQKAQEILKQNYDINKNTWKKKMLNYHPNKGGNTSTFQTVIGLIKQAGYSK